MAQKTKLTYWINNDRKTEEFPTKKEAVSFGKRFVRNNVRLLKLGQIDFGGIGWTTEILEPKTLRQICLANKCSVEYFKMLEITTYILKTSIGTLRITDRNDAEFIPMKFDEGFNLAEFLRVSHDETINPYSFKWNLHSSDKKFNLDRLKSRLEFLTLYFPIQNNMRYFNEQPKRYDDINHFDLRGSFEDEETYPMLFTFLKKGTLSIDQYAKDGITFYQSFVYKSENEFNEDCKLLNLI